MLHRPSPLRSPSCSVHVDCEAVCEQFFADRRVVSAYSDLDEFMLVTINIHGQPGLLERSFNHMCHLAVLDRGVGDWRWSYKNTLSHDWRTVGEMHHPVACVPRRRDVLLICDLRDMLRRFQETGSDLLFCNSRFDWRRLQSAGHSRRKPTRIMAATIII
jgi:hypothetical protein